jgi:hypothetical protein
MTPYDVGGQKWNEEKIRIKFDSRLIEGGRWRTGRDEGGNEKVGEQASCLGKRERHHGVAALAGGGTSQVCRGVRTSQQQVFAGVRLSFWGFRATRHFAIGPRTLIPSIEISSFQTSNFRALHAANTKLIVIRTFGLLPPVVRKWVMMRKLKEDLKEMSKKCHCWF